jgi:hypothetical protein
MGWTGSAHGLLATYPFRKPPLWAALILHAGGNSKGEADVALHSDPMLGAPPKHHAALIGLRAASPQGFSLDLIWRDPATREIIVACSAEGGLPLFGSILPFIGWKWIGCDANGDIVQTEDFNDPTHVRLCFGAAWLMGGWYWPLSGESAVRRTNVD